MQSVADSEKPPQRLDIYFSETASAAGYLFLGERLRRSLSMTMINKLWGAHRTLPETFGVIIRPIQHGDANYLYAMHERLSPESVYSRYLQYRKPTLAELTAVCHLDPAKGAGFVAVMQHDPSLIVGLAYYLRESNATESTAEPGILVEDRFQQQGIGRILWRQLQHHAQRSRITWLHVLFHPQNWRIQRLVQGAGFPYQVKFNGGLSEYLVSLGERSASAVAELTGKERPTRLISHWSSVGEQLYWDWKANPNG
ncbi:MAG: GNAT family N-acetyltransferase [Caldilinea sp. CFX5]|nr:GNAT family N-acetyltransferase [Caldilinea sp. CFX5]